MKKRSIVALISVAALASSVGAQEKHKPPGTSVRNTNAPAAAERMANPADVVARVNGDEIRRKELDDAKQALLLQMRMQGRGLPTEKSADFERQVLEELIGRELVLQEGRSRKIADLDTRAQQELSMLKTKLGGEVEFTKALKEAGLTEEQYMRRLRENMIIRDTIAAVVEQASKVTPEEVKEYYETNRARFHQPEMVRASHILILVPADATSQIKTQKLAQIETVRALLKQGGNFAELAKKFSEDTGTAANGGDLDYFPRGAMVPEFDSVAFTLPTNKVSEVVTTKYGYHLLMVTDRKPAREVPFEEVKGNIEKFLLGGRGIEMTRKHVQDLRTAAKIEVLIDRQCPIPPSPSTNKPAAKP
jgi:peptidyl-prolyl cis-trans isomerase C